jgi:hypothetical protein
MRVRVKEPCFRGHLYALMLPVNGYCNGTSIPAESKHMARMHS